MKSIHLNGKPYAVNLWWQIRSGQVAHEKALLHEARARAEELRARNQETFNCVALRADQYGLGHVLQGDVPRIPSLAASFRAPVQAVQSFLGIFHLEEGWWVCGQSRGVISPDGDRLFETELEARTHAATALRSYFDASCEEVVCLTPEESLCFLLPCVHDDARICRLHRNERHARILFWAVVAGVGLMLAGAAAKWVWDERTESSLREAARQMLQSQEAHRREILADPGRYFNQSWLQEPLADAQGAVCLPALMALALASEGWVLESATCRNSTVLSTWGHRPGASFNRLPLNARLDSPQKAVAQRKLSPAPVRQTASPLFSRSTVTARLYEITRQTGCRLSLNWLSPETKKVENVDVTAPWVRGTWKLEAVPIALVRSGDVFALLSAVPGLSLSDVIFEKHLWQLKGVVHATLQ